MKKRINKPMRAAGILLVATMLTTCMTAGTFAKYTTTDSATDSARVAKFGVTVTANGSLFGEEYVKVADGNTPGIWTDIYDGSNGKGVGTVQVLAKGNGANSNNVVAPGTQNDTGMGFSIKGKPEVDCYVDIEIQAKNIFLKNGNYATMKTIYFANEDEFHKAVANDNIYKYSNNTWTKVAATDSYDGTNTGIYCIIKDIVSSTDFNNAGFYFPVLYKTEDSRTSPTAPSAPTAAMDPDNITTDSIKAITTAMYALRDDTKDSDTAINKLDSSINGYTTAKFRTWVQEANREFNTDFPQVVLKWKWNYEQNDNNKYDKLDTILGNLVAQNSATMSGISAEDNVFKAEPTKATSPDDTICTVVKTSDSGATYSVPTMAQATAATGADHVGAISDNTGDYNLETAIYFSATVTQVD